MSARPRWRGIARALGAWPSSIRFAAGLRLRWGPRVQVAIDWFDANWSDRGGRRRVLHSPGISARLENIATRVG